MLYVINKKYSTYIQRYGTSWIKFNGGRLTVQVETELQSETL